MSSGPSPTQSTSMLQRLLEGPNADIPSKVTADCNLLLGARLNSLYQVLDLNREAHKDETIRIHMPGTHSPKVKSFVVSLIGFKKITEALSNPAVEYIENQDRAALYECRDGIFAALVSDTASTSNSCEGSVKFIGEVGAWLKEKKAIPHFNARDEFLNFSRELCEKVRDTMYRHAGSFNPADDFGQAFDKYCNDFSCTLAVALHFPDGKSFKFFFGNGYSFINHDSNFFGERDDHSKTQPFPVMALLANPYIKPELDMHTEGSMYQKALIPEMLISDAAVESMTSSDGAKHSDLCRHENAPDHEVVYFPLKRLLVDHTPASHISEAAMLYHLICLDEEMKNKPALKESNRFLPVVNGLLEEIRNMNPASASSLPDCTNGNWDEIISQAKLKLKIIAPRAFSEIIDNLSLTSKALHPLHDDLSFVCVPV